MNKGKYIKKIKHCSICDKEFSATSEFFHVRKDSLDGLRAECKECRRFKGKIHIDRLEKRCSICEVLKPNTEKFFHKNKWATHEKYRAMCIQCHSNYSKLYKIKKIYDLTEEEYKKMFIDQNNCCAICKKNNVRLVIDHCHETGKVRGLLCDGCNQGIGCLKDNIENLKNSIKYLNKYKSIDHHGE